MQGSEVLEQPEDKKFITKSFAGSDGGKSIDSLTDSLELLDIDAGYCDVVERTLLALAGIEAPPSKQYRFYDPALWGEDKLKQLDKLEREKIQYNSIFLHLPLSDPNVEKLQKFINKIGLEFNDYTRTLSKEEGGENVKLIRIDAKGAKEILFPMIVGYLVGHTDDIKMYHQEIDEKRKAKAAQYKLENKDNAAKNQDSSGSYSWGRLFNKGTALAALTVAAAAATMTFSNRK